MLFQELLLADEVDEESNAATIESSTADSGVSAGVGLVPNDNDNPSNDLPSSSTTMNQLDEVNVPSSQPQSQPPTAASAAATTSNMLRVPSSGYGGAIPRRPFSRDSSAESSTSLSTPADTTKTCFCGHYTEVSPRGLGVLFGTKKSLV